MVRESEAAKCGGTATPFRRLQFLSLELGREGNVVHLRPEVVVEIAVNEIQTSPQYPAGMALRFARVKRFRPEKAASEADSIDTVRALFAAQAGVECITIRKEHSGHGAFVPGVAQPSTWPARTPRTLRCCRSGSWRWRYRRPYP